MTGESLDDPDVMRRLRARCRRYGLTVDEFVALWESQRGRCAICRCGLVLRTVRIDHFHDADRPGPEWRAEQVRGLLCNACNTALPQHEAESADDLVRHLGWLANELESARRRLDLYERARPLYLRAVKSYLEGAEPPEIDTAEADLLELGRAVPWRHIDWAGPGFDIGGAVIEFTTPLRQSEG